MNLDEYYIDELIDIRASARKDKDWKLSDEIREFLDAKHVFIFDSIDGQIVYHEGRGTRQDMIDRLNVDRQAEANFDAWLFTMSKKITNNFLCQ